MDFHDAHTLPLRPSSVSDRVMVTSQHENSSTCLQHRHSLCPHLSSPRHVHSSYWCEPVPVRESDQKLRVFAQESLSLCGQAMTFSASMMTRPLRAFSLRISSTVPRLELDTGRPARHVRDLEYHTGEHGFLPVSLSSLTSYSDDTAPKFDGCPVGGAQSIKGTTAIGRLTGTPHHRASSAS